MVTCCTVEGVTGVEFAMKTLPSDKFGPIYMNIIRNPCIIELMT